jgi:4-hydroxythreonine-4-phosphate dehydrogenase
LNRKYVVTGGDPAGCSPWLARDLLREREPDETLVFVGPASLRGFLVEQKGESLAPGIEWVEAGRLDSDQLASGVLSAETGEVAYRSLREALKLSYQDLDGLLTLPLSKKHVQAAGYTEFVGHTELLEDHFGTDGVMTFFGSSMVVALLTRHCPLREVPDRVTREKIRWTVRTITSFYEKKRDRKPSVAVLGLNPHAGEDGTLGTLERDVMSPALEELRDDGYDVSGPYPADSYLPVHGEESDVILAPYHDQGLVPFKQKHFFDGVHATLGLPIARVSPDHGVAAEVAPTGSVDSTSTLNGLRWLRGGPLHSHRE